MRFGNSFVIKTKIKIDADAGAIDLRDTSRYEWLARQTPLCIFVEQSAFNVIADSESFRLWH
jgi:hypothetical protein